jgi:hypothetical protein
MLTIAAGPTTKFDTTALLGLAAAGYAGVDFLEGMSGKLGGTAPPADRQ